MLDAQVPVPREARDADEGQPQCHAGQHVEVKTKKTHKPIQTP